jgi:2-C-methyl-D-erythritol 4-phosphate cytidylyltransferase
MSGPVAHWAIIPAAGIGRRMRSQVPKQYLPLGDRTVIEYTLTRFIDHPQIAGIAIAIDVRDEIWRSLQVSSAKPIITVDGGRERCHSVLNALQRLTSRAQAHDWVLVHDAVRPCLSDEDLNKLMRELADDPVGGILAVPVRDTLKRAGSDGRIASTLNRTALWQALTPQMFRLGVLASALAEALAAGDLVTDEAAAVERAGLRPRLVEGRGDNIKITRPEDLVLAERILAAQAQKSRDF